MCPNAHLFSGGASLTANNMGLTGVTVKVVYCINHNSAFVDLGSIPMLSIIEDFKNGIHSFSA